LRKGRIKKECFEQSFERGEVLSISHFLRQVVPEDCGFYGEQSVARKWLCGGLEHVEGFCFQNAMSVWSGKDRSTPEDKGGQRHAKLEIQCIEV